MIKAGIQVEVKDVGEKTLEMIGSNELMDRDYEVIKSDGWQLDNFLKNPVILFAHDPSQPPIAKAVGVAVESGMLKFRIKFPEDGVYPFADTIYKLYKGGFMSASSVGFLPKEWKDGSGQNGEPYRTYLKQELLELSLVPVPSNPQALVTAKSYGEKAVEGKAISKDEFDVLVEKLSSMLKEPLKEEVKKAETKENSENEYKTLSQDLNALKMQLCEFKGIVDDLKAKVARIESLEGEIKELKEERTKYDLLLLKSSGLKPTLDFEQEVIEALKLLKQEC